jgi:hypothetical protein
MRVVALQRHRNRKVVAVAKELLQLAEEGALHGLTFVAKFGRKDHRAGVVGDYQRSPEEAVYAALRMKQQLLNEDMT